MNCPKCHGPLQFVRLPDSVDIESCPFCNGVFYDLSDLTLDLSVDNLTASRYICPKCGGGMKVGTVFEGQLTLEHCSGCQGVWLDPGEVQKLRKLSGKEKIVGTRGTPDVEAPPPPKPAPAEAPASKVDPSVKEFGGKLTGGKPRKGTDEPVQPPDCGDWNNPDIARNPVATHEGRSYQHFQTSKPMTAYVLGEFNWKVKVGDLAVARDFVSPPFIISEDRTDSDTTWSLGEYVEPAEIWQGFKLDGEPPPRKGVAPAQPNPHEETFASMGRAFWPLAAAALGIFIFAVFFCQNKRIQSFDFRYDITDTEKSRITLPFELTGRASN
ncbi:MAG: DUF4178 domain-containing protein, partial [Elusimicrobiota bacterium]